MHVLQIETIGLAVDLEEAADLERLLDHARDIDVARPTRADASAGQVPDAVHVRVVHRLQHTLGRPVVRRVVHRRDDPVERGQFVLRHVDLAVRADVGLDAREDAQLRVLRPHGLDLLELLREPPIAEVVRVIRDRVVLVPASERSSDHLLERVLPVGRPVRVRVQVAAQVFQLDEVG